MSLSLNEVLPNLQSNDPEIQKQAVERVYNNYSRWLINEACKILDNKDDAISIVDESLAKLPERVANAKFLVPPYLLQDVIQRCCRFRKQKIQGQKVARSLEDIGYRSEDGQSIPFDPEDTRPQARQLVESSELFQTAWNKLPPPDQMILTLRFVEGRQQLVVADDMQVSVETVRDREKRARERLRKLLGDDGLQFGDTPERPDSGLSQ